MGRKRKVTRRTPKARPSGILEVAADGFGFVSTAEGEFFIPASKIAGACDGDLVEIAPAKVNSTHKSSQGKQVGMRPTARVLRVLHRAHEYIVGRYEVADPFGVVVPEDARIPFDIFTKREDSPNIAHGCIVRVRIVEYPTRNSAAFGVVEEVLGFEGDPGIEVDALIARYKLETQFSEEALEAAAAAVVDVEGALAAGYVDERERFVFTVDPFDAKDFDDAISVSAVLPNGGVVDAARSSGGTLPPCADHSTYEHTLGSAAGLSCSPDDRSLTLRQPAVIAEGAKWRLGVHIADVSHYVPYGSAVDIEARKRATSTYLVDRVLPMLPEALSNEVCSLVPGQARRAFTIDVVLSEDFQVLSTDFHLSIIESKARLSYDQAQCYIDAALRGQAVSSVEKMLAQQPTPQGAIPLSGALHETLLDALAHLNRFAQARARARAAAGGIDFETTEAKVQLDVEGKPSSVALRKKTAATSCVEEAMILANECAAKRLIDTNTPGIFRVHDAPRADSLASLVPILQEFGYDAHVSLDAFAAGNPQAIQAVLARAHARVEAALISSLLLRAQQRAVYSAQCREHFGLASAAYCHFTSPIRRYPDLVVHRMLKTLIFKRSETYTQECDSLPWLAEHASNMERSADAAARESQELKLVEYMEQFTGQEFDGIISGVATYGLFVQLENTAEGVVSVRSLGSEYFALDPVAYKLTGQESGQVYRLGQQVRVQLLPAQKHARKLEFKLVR